MHPGVNISLWAGEWLALKYRIFELRWPCLSRNQNSVNTNHVCRIAAYKRICIGPVCLLKQLSEPPIDIYFKEISECECLKISQCISFPYLNEYLYMMQWRLLIQPWLSVLVQRMSFRPKKMSFWRIIISLFWEENLLNYYYLPPF